ncbi:RagB/SusD family nutrient uptake outer membrane protein [Arenibacter sp. S6351L]|uniref:RagB/SusD family nutrient uptake outer membrane protein n=1 Tax=Arenibacter sp. S6351L TaxID=2926407 RepID=UPI001FF3642D|nr:RagB/SusD family nutrient uptake outer membrane protein [Arenibacter sp. S6351L]MCK0135791.1 RagB/SusD family nutrient uptake outer membrane protein [Arenibacter sp. S6351L]
MKTQVYIKQFMVIIFFCHFASCEEFVELESPDLKIVSEVVFNNDVTAISAMKGIYNELVRATFSGGWQNSVTALASLSADECTGLSITNLTYTEFEENEIMPSNTRNLEVWSSAYNIIYMTNSILEGLENSKDLTEEIRIQLEGEAKFVRAFSYFYLVNLYGPVPLLLSTEYQINARAASNSKEEVYGQILKDLQEAIGVLADDYKEGERTYINRFAAMALMSRVNLYQQNWTAAENWSSQVISETGRFEILEDLNEVFLANSREAIWQLSPVGNGDTSTQTNEGAIFIIHPTSPSASLLKLNDDLVGSFESQDKRLAHWIDLHEGINAYYPYKYKDRNSTNNLTEYSMVLRLAEQYLIRAEARAMLDNLPGAIADLNSIRSRADIPAILETDPTLTKEILLELILNERRIELFTEWGHRWLDLKRTENTSEVLAPKKSLWQDTDVLYPVPEQERLKNANLGQNPGY